MAADSSETICRPQPAILYTKILACVCLGYIIARRGIFTPASAKGVSILSLNVSLPALIFSSIVTAFNPDNISAFGSLALVAVLYQTLGLLLALLVKHIFYVPMDFQWGIIVMGITSNWGNLPIAVVQTLGRGAPFRGQIDVDLGIAYDSVFVLLMNTCFFPLGLHKLCALDFKAAHLAKSPPTSLSHRIRMRLKRSRSGASNVDSDRSASDLEASADLQMAVRTPVVNQTDARSRNSINSNDEREAGEDPSELKLTVSRYLGDPINRKASRASSFSSMLERTRPIPPTAPLDAPASDSCPPDAQSFHRPTTPVPSVHNKPSWQRIKKIASGFLMPTTIALVIALPCALVPALKALFTPVDGWTGGRMPNAPDDGPPLQFILETATSLGGITIPASLILLGASIARLQKPDDWRDLPIASIIAMAIAKMIIVPVFGIFMVQGLRDHTTLFPKEDKMRTFLSILCSGTPAAINQLVVTQLYNPAGTAHTLAMNLALQYALMPILSTAVAGIALYVVE